MIATTSSTTKRYVILFYLLFHMSLGLFRATLCHQPTNPTLNPISGPPRGCSSSARTPHYGPNKAAGEECAGALYEANEDQPGGKSRHQVRRVIGYFDWLEPSYVDSKAIKTLARDYPNVVSTTIEKLFNSRREPKWMDPCYKREKWEYAAKRIGVYSSQPYGDDGSQLDTIDPVEILNSKNLDVNIDVGAPRSRLIFSQASRTTSESTLVDKTRSLEGSGVEQSIEKLSASDISISWYISTIKSRLDDAAALVVELIEATKVEANSLNKTRAHEIEQGRRNWMPNLEELFDDVNQKIATGAHQVGVGGIYNNETRSLLTNLTQYLELFAVALEEMSLEENLEGRDSAKNGPFERLELTIIGLLCKMEDLMEKVQEQEKNLLEFDKLLPHIQRDKLKAKSLVLVDKFTSTTNPRLMRYSGKSTMSPLRLAYDKSVSSKSIAQIKAYDENGNQLDSIISEAPKHIWRQIMPLDQRRLASKQERAYRDQSILSELKRLIENYQVLLLHNYD